MSESLSLLSDGPEYTARQHAAFTPPDVQLSDLRRAIPKDAFRRSTLKALWGMGPVFLLTVVMSYAGLYIDWFVACLGWSAIPTRLLKWTLWTLYWNIQGVAWAGLWSIGHEAGHNNVSQNKWVNHGVGMACHSFLFLPYFSWRITHLRHHKTAGSMELEEVYVPHVRSYYKLPPPQEASQNDYKEVFEELPIFLLVRFCAMQFLGLHTYLTLNTMGSQRYPEGSNHWNPYSGLFTKEEYTYVSASNAGLVATVLLLRLLASHTSTSFVFKYYFIPFLISNHWIMAMTFLQHSDPTVPFYRGKSWTRTRGALSTIDRPFFGWVGVVFFLGVNHHHTTHHLFANIPFYNLPMAHEAIRPLLGDAYNYDSTPILRALWRSFTQCLFVEEEGDVLFFKNSEGVAKRQVKDDGFPNK
ncbi:uncharacterized protein PHACADRAFT_211585 [Phanerochaete carnosa HHB-10118-sp]|uniref:Fatty acid desaturase domain-containing protein n=1 Tax=Phanerochaete carnosa (strain HHB-10118-sp) TaxID=650164 RepID=K5UR45_PHACS|nr:uncharacterized protein PHACADRAFT_211585 [Phanerochaete carnosa HHB-10118-sp]EKM52311.1 hypothetical protein PHACADRAFT_211585 [Phanerochaete carnosa HHB-10118-sp]